MKDGEKGGWAGLRDRCGSMKPQESPGGSGQEEGMACPGLGTHRQATFSRCQVCTRLGRIHQHPLSLPSSSLDPNLVAFLRSHSHVHEQAGEKATEEQRPGGPSVEVTGEEPIVPTSPSEPRQEDELEPEAPGLEKGVHLLGNKSRGKYPF